MEIGWILGGLFVFLTIGYVAIALFFPELVGIQGKAAREIESSHQEESKKTKY